MEKEKMISKVYKVISDKTLREGCIFEGYCDNLYGYGSINGQFNTLSLIEECNKNDCKVVIHYITKLNNSIELMVSNGDKILGSVYFYIEKIIGSPVMLGDLLDYFDNKERYEDGNLSEGSVEYLDEIENYILGHYNKKRLSIDEQDDSIIEYIYNLIK